MSIKGDGAIFHESIKPITETPVVTVFPRDPWGRTEQDDTTSFHSPPFSGVL